MNSVVVVEVVVDVVVDVVVGVVVGELVVVELSGDISKVAIFVKTAPTINVHATTIISRGF